MIRASSGRAVDALATDLASANIVTRDAAVARLAVIGARAAARVIAVAIDRTASVSARIAAFRVLESIADARALEPALVAAADPDPMIAAAAIGVARIFLNKPQGVKVLDHITSIALDQRRDRVVRLAAVRALADLEPSTIQPIVATLHADPDAEIAAVVAAPVPRKAAGPTSSVQRVKDAAAGALGDDPAALRRALLRSADELTTSALHQIVERVRIREGAEPEQRRGEWMAVRATAHGALARRGSRLALYDLRETLAAAKAPLAGDFVAALAAIGEASCLEPIATAYSRASAAPGGGDDWWQRHLGDAFRTIVTREAITRRNAVVKKIEKKWPGLFDALVQPVARKTSGRPATPGT